MPELSRFLGIVIGMFPREHNPPHFHAVYGDYHVTVEIQSGTMKEVFPKRASALLQEWRNLHQEELQKNWNRLQAGNSAEKIAPLE